MNRDQWLAGERLRAVADAQSYLVDFAATFTRLPWPMKPAATKFAVGYLVVVALADPVRAEIFMREVAKAADVSTTMLRKTVAAVGEG